MLEGDIENKSIEQLLIKEKAIRDALMVKFLDVKKDYNLMFYGPGKLAKEGIKAILNGYSDFYTSIPKIYLVGKDKDKHRIDMQHFKNECDKIQNHSAKVIPIVNTDKGLAEFIQDTDVFFLTAAVEEEQKDRLASCRKNLRLTEEIAPLLEGYSGLICIASNIPEIIAYNLISKANIDPTRIICFAAIDKIRLDKELSLLLADEIQDKKTFMTTAFTTGYHDKPWCVFNRAFYTYVDRTSESRERSLEISPQNQARIRDNIRKIPYHQYDLQQRLDQKGSPTAISNGAALKEILLAITNHIGFISASIFYQFRDDIPELFIELPVRFNKDTPYVCKNLLENMTEEDIAETVRSIKALESEIRLLTAEGLISRPSKAYAQAQGIQFGRKELIEAALLKTFQREIQSVPYEENSSFKNVVEAALRRTFETEVRNIPSTESRYQSRYTLIENTDDIKSTLLNMFKKELEEHFK